MALTVRLKIPRSLISDKHEPENSEPVFLGLGSNLGDRLGSLKAALHALEAADVEVVTTSSVYESAAHVPEGESQPDYLNAVAEVRTRLEPIELLRTTMRVEAEAGRTRQRPWQPRTLDIDILLFGSRSISHGELVLPHPRMALRRFVLEPLAEIAPDYRVPEPLKSRVQELLAHCPDSQPVRRVYGPASLYVTTA